MDDRWSRFFWDYKSTDSLEESTDPAKIFIDQPFWVFLNRFALLGYILNDISVLDSMRLKKDERSSFEKNCVKELDEVIRQMAMPSAETYVSPLLQKEIFCPAQEAADKDAELQKKALFFAAVAKALDLLSSSQIQPEVLYPLWHSNDKSFPDFFWKEQGSTRNGGLLILAFAAYCTFIDQPEKNSLQHWMQFCHQVCSDLHDEQSFAGAVSMCLICLKSMRDDGESDVYAYLARKYKYAFDSENADKCLSLPRWHFSIKDPVDQNNPQTIYNRLFGTLKLFPAGRQIRFQSSAIWQEAFKSYLRVIEGGEWPALLEDMEKSPLLRGNVAGLISDEDSDGDLFANARKRFENLSNGSISFSKNHQNFISLLKEIELTSVETFSTAFDYSMFDNWNSEVVGKRYIAEAVCKVLLGVENAEASDSDDLVTWRKMLLDFPELLTEWAQDSVHSVGRYRKDGAIHLFKKKYITSGTILLNPDVHNRITDFLKYVVPCEFEEKMDCNGQIFYVCKSVDCILVFGTVPDIPGVRVKFMTQGVVKEYLKDSFWGSSTPMVLWRDIQNEEDIQLFLQSLSSEETSGENITGSQQLF